MCQQLPQIENVWLKNMSINEETVVDYLLNLTSRHQLVERAIEHCDIWFNNEGGQIDGWISQDLDKKFFSHKLVFKRSDWDLVYIDTHINLVASNNQIVGSYRLITTLDGEADDDYFVLEISKDDWEKAL
jgi:hypothetical protein